VAVRNWKNLPRVAAFPHSGNVCSDRFLLLASGANISREVLKQALRHA
jgi:hypothetical protein